MGLGEEIWATYARLFAGIFPLAIVTCRRRNNGVLLRSGIALQKKIQKFQFGS